MHPPSLVRLAVSAASFALCALPLPSLAASVNVDISQTSAVRTLGTWTLQKPTQQSESGSDAARTLTGLDPGHFTLFDKPPAGTTVHIKLQRNGVDEQTVEYPQITFDANDGDAISLAIAYSLTNTGKVGVNSDPSGIPFILYGPNGMVQQGVTPSSFEGVPVGSYSVHYKPSGCNEPPSKSDVLVKNGVSYFSVTIRCDTLKTAAASSSSETTLSTHVNGDMITFTDVPSDAWYAAFAGSVARQGIITGYTDTGGVLTGLFGPMNTVTVAELSKIAHLAAGVNERDFAGAPMNPQAVGQWFTRYVADAENRGWAIYTDSIEMARPVTRGEVMMTFLQALDIPLQWAKGGVFTDVTPRTPYASAIETAHRIGIADGSTDESGKATGLFHPELPINRAEMSKLLITIQEMRKKMAAASSSSSR
jgi:hypothetical protein